MTEKNGDMTLPLLAGAGFLAYLWYTRAAAGPGGEQVLYTPEAAGSKVYNPATGTYATLPAGTRYDPGSGLYILPNGATYNPATGKYAAPGATTAPATGGISAAGILTAVPAVAGIFKAITDTVKSIAGTGTRAPAPAPSTGADVLKAAQSTAGRLPVKDIYQSVTGAGPYTSPYSPEELQSIEKLYQQEIPAPEYPAGEAAGYVSPYTAEELQVTQELYQAEIPAPDYLPEVAEYVAAYSPEELAPITELYQAEIPAPEYAADIASDFATGAGTTVDAMTQAVSDAETAASFAGYMDASAITETAVETTLAAPEVTAESSGFLDWLTSWW